MFRKPKRRNVNQRENIETEAIESELPVKSLISEEQSFDDKLQVERKPMPVQKSVLTFAEEEEDEESIVSSRNLFDGDTRSNLKPVHKVRKRREKLKSTTVQSIATPEVIQVKHEVKQEAMEIEISDEEPDTSSIAPSSQQSFADIKARYQSTENNLDVHDPFPSSTDIPDAKAVYEARKRREIMRTTGAGVQPVIPLASNHKTVVEDRHAQLSRLVREDDNDMSDEENGDDLGMITSKSLLVDEEQQRRNEQLEALRLEQGESDEDESSQESVKYLGEKRSNQRSKMWGNDDNSSDEEVDRYEREQMLKAIGRRKLDEVREEAAAYRKSYQDPQSLIHQDRYVDEDMDIEVISQPATGNSSVPSFLNLSDGTLRRPRRYADMTQLLEKLEHSVISRREEIKTKQYQIEQYTQHIAENKESILKLADANLQMERKLHHYQEMKYYTDNALNCLDEKIQLINEIESSIFDLWKICANDLARRRVEERNRRRFDRFKNNWNSDEEELKRPETYSESIKRLIERANTIFEDTLNEYCDFGTIIRRFADWLHTNPRSFRDAYVAECIPKLVGPFVRIELFEWNPLSIQNPPLHQFNWYQSILRLGFNNEEVDVNDPAISGLIPDIVEKVVVPKITKIVNELWDPMSLGQTQRLTEQIDQFVSTFPTLNRNSKFFTKLLDAMRQKAQTAIQLEREIPAHLTSIVTEIRQEAPIEQSGSFGNDYEDMQALLAQSQSILK